MASNITTHPHAAAHSHDSSHSHGGPKVYALVLMGLLFLTVVTVGVSYLDFGGGVANVIIAMLIASIKGSLVALFFMHLRWDKPISAVIFCATLFFLSLFLIGCYTDIIARAPTQPTNMKPGGAPGGLVDGVAYHGTIPAGGVQPGTAQTTAPGSTTQPAPAAPKH